MVSAKDHLDGPRDFAVGDLTGMQYQQESDALKNAFWPRCDELASALSSRGLGALPALQAALTSRKHHVRSACLRAINMIDPEVAKSVARDYINDRAFEVRETAALILGIEVPK